MSRARHYLTGSATILAAQMSGMILQLIYTALVSRWMAPAAFGSYAVALSASALVGLVAAIGLGNASARAQEPTVANSRSVLTISVLSGLAGAAALLLIAVPWSRIWGDSGAASVMAVMAVGMVCAPASAVCVGMLRRRGSFSALALVIVLSNAAAMTLGLVAVSATRSAPALAVMSAATPVLLWAAALPTLKRHAIPGRVLRSSRVELHFGARVTLNSILIYISNMIPQLALSRSVGPSTLGNWNRAIALTQVPIESVWTSALSTLYPQFRDALVEPERARRVWVDLLSLVSMVVWPLCFFGVPLLPTAFSIVLGDQWGVAASMGQWILAAMAFCFSYAIMAAAMESAGLFRNTYKVTGLGLVIFAAGAIGVVWSRNWIWAGVSLLVAYIAMHLFQVALAGTLRLVAIRTLLAHYLLSALISVLMISVTATICMLFDSQLIRLGVALLALTMGCAGGWVLRGRLAPITVLTSYLRRP